MLVRPHLPGYRWFHVFRNAAIRTGVYVGVCLTLVFTAWLVIANHAPFLGSLCDGTQYRRRRDPVLSRRGSHFSVSCACPGISWPQAFLAG